MVMSFIFVRRSRASRALTQWRRSDVRVNARTRVASDSNCTSSGNRVRNVAVPSLRTSASTGTRISFRRRSPGIGCSSPTASSRASGCKATRRSRRTKSATTAVSLSRCPGAVMSTTVGLRSGKRSRHTRRAGAGAAAQLARSWHSGGYVGVRDQTGIQGFTCINAGGRGRFRTADRWCVKPELYH